MDEGDGGIGASRYEPIDPALLNRDLLGLQASPWARPEEDDVPDDGSRYASPAWVAHPRDDSRDDRDDDHFGPSSWAAHDDRYDDPYASRYGDDRHEDDRYGDRYSDTHDDLRNVRYDDPHDVDWAWRFGDPHAERLTSRFDDLDRGAHSAPPTYATYDDPDPPRRWDDYGYRDVLASLTAYDAELDAAYDQRFAADTRWDDDRSLDPYVTDGVVTPALAEPARWDVAGEPYDAYDARFADPFADPYPDRYADPYNADPYAIDSSAASPYDGAADRLALPVAPAPSWYDDPPPPSRAEEPPAPDAAPVLGGPSLDREPEPTPQGDLAVAPDPRGRPAAPKAAAPAQPAITSTALGRLVVRVTRRAGVEWKDVAPDDV